MFGDSVFVFGSSAFGKQAEHEANMQGLYAPQAGERKSLPEQLKAGVLGGGEEKKLVGWTSK